MIKCSECGTLYDPDSVYVPNPIPQYMCGKCGTQFTKEETESLPWPYNPNASESETA